MSDLIGQTIGNFHVDALLGRGGMGNVYRVSNPFSKRPRAIKVLRPELAAQPTYSERFLREVHAIESLKHPYIVDISDVGRHGDLLYFVMEYADRGTLHDLLKTERSALSTALEFMQQAALALEAAHKRDLIHRDVKPANMLLFSDGADSTILKLADFGLVRVVDDSSLTAFETVLGTPLYMSPEQCQGFPIDRRTDIYSLGVVFYEVVTGMLPFDGDSNAVKLKQINEPPPPPRHRNSSLPVEVEQIVLRCLAKRPDQRYERAALLAEELERVRRGLPAEPGSNAAVLRNLLREPPIAPPPSSHPTPPAAPARDDQPTMIQPKAAPALTPSASPLVRVFDKSDHLVAERPITEVGLSVGRSATTDVRLDDQEVSRRHLEIAWNGATATVTDRSSNGALLNGSPLPPNQKTAWPWDGTVVVGPYRLTLVQPASLAASPGVTTFDPVDPSAASRPKPATAQPIPEGALTLTLPVKTFSLTVEKMEVFKVILRNAGDVVERLRIEIAGVPKKWVRGLDQEVPLNDRSSKTVELQIIVPRSSESRAQDYSIKVHAHSVNAERPGTTNTELATFSVEQFGQSTLELKRPELEGYRRATFTALITNEGNAKVRYMLSVDDKKRVLGIKLDPSFDVEPGEIAERRIMVTGKPYWIGRAPIHSFEVKALAAGQQIKSATGQFTQKVYVPMLLAILFLLLLLALAHFLTQPVLEVGRVVPPDARKDTAVTLNWQVRGNWQYVELRPLGVIVVAPTTSYTYVLSDTRPIQVTVVAVNDILGIPRRDVGAVAVEPGATVTSTPTPPLPSPVGLDFHIEPQTVYRFLEASTVDPQPVAVWSVANAESLTLSPPDGISLNPSPDLKRLQLKLTIANPLDVTESQQFIYTLQATNRDDSMASPLTATLQIELVRCGVPETNTILYQGPGANYNPAAVQSSIEVVYPIARDASANWLWVQVKGSGSRGWIKKSLVNSCKDQELAKLPLKSSDVAPPTLTPTITPSPTLTPSPTRTPVTPSPTVPSPTPTPRWLIDDGAKVFRVTGSRSDGTLCGDSGAHIKGEIRLKNQPKLRNFRIRLDNQPEDRPDPAQAYGYCVPPGDHTITLLAINDAPLLPPERVVIRVTQPTETFTVNFLSKADDLDWLWLIRDGDANGGSGLFRVDEQRDTYNKPRSGACIKGRVQDRNGNGFVKFLIGWDIKGKTHQEYITNPDYQFCDLDPGEYTVTLYRINETDIDRQEQPVIGPIIRITRRDQVFIVNFTAKVPFPQ